MGHLWGQAWGRGTLPRDPAASWGAEGLGLLRAVLGAPQVPSPAVSATGRGQAVRDPYGAQKAPFLMQKMPISGRGPREALCVGSSSDVLGSSRHRVHPLPPLGAQLWGGCCLLSPGSTRMLAWLAVGVTLADPFVQGDSAYRCPL